MLAWVREFVTVFCVLIFIAVVWYAYAARNKSRHDAAAQSIIDDDDAVHEELNR